MAGVGGRRWGSSGGLSGKPAREHWLGALCIGLVSQWVWHSSWATTPLRRSDVESTLDRLGGVARHCLIDPSVNNSLVCRDV